MMMSNPPYNDKNIDQKDIEFQRDFKHNLERLREREKLRKKYRQPMKGYIDHNAAGRNFWGVRSKEEKNNYKNDVIELAKKNKMMGRWYSWYKDWLLIDIDDYLEIPPKAIILYIRNKETKEYEPYVRIFKETSIDKGLNQKLIREIMKGIKFEHSPRRKKKISRNDNIKLQQANDLRQITKKYIKQHKKERNNLLPSQIKKNSCELLGDNPPLTHQDIANDLFVFPEKPKDKPVTIEELLKRFAQEIKINLDKKRARNKLKARLKRLK